MRKNIRRILCATDLSEVSRIVVPYGIALASKLNAELYVCHVIDLPTISVYGEAVFDPVTQQQRFMDFARKEIENQLRDAPAESTPLITLGHTTEEISRLAWEYDIDLVITVTHGRSGLKRLFLGSVTARLMRILGCPLLVLRAFGETEEKPARRKLPFERILVGCDFSGDSNAAFECSLNLAQEFESELHLVHVVEPTEYKEHLKFPSRPGEPLEKSFHDSIREKLSAMVPEEAMNWCSGLQTSVLVGKPYAELVGYAEKKDIDLIALGVRGHGMVENLLVGSTTDRVVRRAPCPMISVNPGAREEQ
ncbi:MAG: universal stress protein [Desulfobacterales bacterium]|nr:universal stress protein [Desulfobacterales bacterium]